MTKLLRWIAVETAECGLVDENLIKDKEAYHMLLKTGHVFNPMLGYARSVASLSPEELKRLGKGEQPDEPESDPGWEWRTPMPKRKGDIPVPYQFLAYAKFDGAASQAYNQSGFGIKTQIGKYNYGRINGGLARRKVGA